MPTWLFTGYAKLAAGVIVVLALTAAYFTMRADIRAGVALKSRFQRSVLFVFAFP